MLDLARRERRLAPLFGVLDGLDDGGLAGEGEVAGGWGCNAFELETGVGVGDRLKNNNASRAADLAKPAEVDKEQAKQAQRTCFYPRLARLNHSCVPNARCTRPLKREDWSVQLRATRDIAVGEEVCISYLGSRGRSGGRRSKDVIGRRKEELWANWGFWCACAGCVTGMEWDVVESEEEGEGRVLRSHRRS